MGLRPSVPQSAPAVTSNTLIAGIALMPDATVIRRPDPFAPRDAPLEPVIMATACPGQGVDHVAARLFLGEMRKPFAHRSHTGVMAMNNPQSTASRLPIGDKADAPDAENAFVFGDDRSSHVRNLFLTPPHSQAHGCRP
jgi:hypothetical protein